MSAGRGSKPGRRTILGRPVKGKVRWYPHSISNKHYRFLRAFAFCTISGEGCLKPQFVSTIIGKDQNGQFVVPLYKSCRYDYEIPNKERDMYTLVYAITVRVGHIKEDCSAVIHAINEQIKRTIENPVTWFAEAGFNRGSVKPEIDPFIDLSTAPTFSKDQTTLGAMTDG